MSKSDGLNADFDPYRKWLGIPESKRPVTHYILLGLSLNEEDHEVIRSAAARQRSFVERFLVGEHERHAMRLITRGIRYHGIGAELRDTTYHGGTKR